MRNIRVLDRKRDEVVSLERKEDEIEFWVEKPSDEREIRYKNKYEEKYQRYGLGSNTYNIEKKLRNDMKELRWKESERRGSKSKNMKYKKMDLMNEYEDEERWRVRMKVNSKGKTWFWIEI